MRKLLVLVAATLVMAAPQAAAKPGHDTVLGFVTQGRTQVLTQLDALTLQPRGRGVAVGTDSATVIAHEPRSGRVAVAGGDWVRLRIVDLAAGRVLRTVDLAGRYGGGSVAAGLWPQPSRLVLLTTGNDAGVFTVGLGRRTSLRWRSLDGPLVAWAKTSTSLLALLAPREGLGPARLAVVDAAGRVRTVDLPGVVAGWTAPEGDDYLVRMQLPGLAVDPSGTRALVVPASGPLVEVDLASLRATPHPTRALSKLARGSQRSAVWFAPNLVAVTGTDGDGEQHEWTPAGLTLIDTRDWSTRFVEEGVHGTMLAGGTLVACGRGLTGYAASGARTFHALDETAPTSMAAGAGYAYLTSDFRSFTVVDTTTGEVVARPKTRSPTWIAGSW